MMIIIIQEARGKVILLEKDVSSLRVQLRLQNDEIYALEASVKTYTETMSRLEVDSQAMEIEVEKCQKRLLEEQIKHAIEQQQSQRISDIQTAEFQTRVNELEQLNTDLSHQINDLQSLVKKQKQEYIVNFEEAIRENWNSLVKYRNDNTKLIVQVSTSEDFIRSQEKSFKGEILRLSKEYDKCCQELNSWKHENALVTSLLASTQASEVSLKNALHDAEGKATLYEGCRRNLESKIHENLQELTIMKDEKRMLEEMICHLNLQCSSLQEQLKVLKETYEEEASQVKTSLDADRARLQEDFRDKVSLDAHIMDEQS